MRSSARTRPGKGVRPVQAALLAAALLSGCTLVKPVVGAVTGPFLIFEGGGSFQAGCDAGCLVALVGFGVVGGLVTGVISDVAILTGDARHDPAANWWHPYRTNLDP